jgi:hypothetical protein
VQVLKLILKENLVLLQLLHSLLSHLLCLPKIICPLYEPKQSFNVVRVRYSSHCCDFPKSFLIVVLLLADKSFGYLKLSNPFPVHYLPLLQLVDYLLRPIHSFKDLHPLILNFSHLDIKLSLLLDDIADFLNGCLSDFLLVIHLLSDFQHLLCTLLTVILE